MDDKKITLNCTTLVGNENTYRDTISRLRVAHTIGHGLHALSPTAVTVLKQLNEDSPGATICIPPGVIEGNASAREARNPLECNPMARIRPDTMPPKQHVL
jgi:hypothetical protein